MALGFIAKLFGKGGRPQPPDPHGEEGENKGRADAGDEVIGRRMAGPSQSRPGRPVAAEASNGRKTGKIVIPDGDIQDSGSGKKSAVAMGETAADNGGRPGTDTVEKNDLPDLPSGNRTTGPVIQGVPPRSSGHTEEESEPGRPRGDMTALSGSMEEETTPAREGDDAQVSPITARNAKVSQTFRVSGPIGTAPVSAGDLPGPISTPNAKVSQTFRVDALHAGGSAAIARDRGAGAVSPPEDHRSRQISQTFKVDSPHTGGSVAAGSVPPVAEERPAVRISQTFKVGGPDGTAGLDSPRRSPVPVSENEKPWEQGDGWVEIPLAFMLAELPPAFRGPAWDEMDFPKTVLELSPDDVAHVIRKGRMSVAIDDFRALVPSGWISKDAFGEVVVPLADLLDLFPEELLTEAPAESDLEKLFAGSDGDEIPGAPAVSESLEEHIDLPCSIILSALPLEWRGPLWDESTFPDDFLPISLDDLREQLSRGRVSVPVSLVRSYVPDGLLADVAEGDVPLDLAQVVGVIPPEVLTPVGKEMDDVQAVSAMPDFFRPATAAAFHRGKVGSAGAEANVPVPGKKQAVRSVELPFALILAAVPDEARGEAWREGAYPPGTVSLPREELLMQLGTGKVSLPLLQIRSQLPPRWVRPDAGGMVTLGLADVVSAIPADVLTSDRPMLEDVAAASRLPAFFQPQADVPVMDLPGTVPGDTAAAVSSVMLPLSLILGQLSEGQRGPAWQVSGAPAGEVPVDRDVLLSQLASGRVSLELLMIRSHLPAGWIAADASGTLEFEAVQVVPLLPADLFAIDRPLMDGVEEVSRMPDFFKSSQPPPAQPVAAPLPPAAVGEEERVSPKIREETSGTEVTVPVVTGTVTAGPSEPSSENLDIEADELLDGAPEWLGAEGGLEQAPRGVNINTASIRELTELNGFGESRAKAVVLHRNTHGPFTSIYDLGGVPGVGPSMFRKATGLSLTTRTNRHQILEDLLDLKADGTTLVQRIINQMTQILRASGGLITNVEGIALATSGEISADSAKYAALGARFFFRTRRHLEKFVASASDSIILPGSTPPLFVLAHDEVVLIFTLRSAIVPARKLNVARRALREIAWLLGRRAVVLAH